MKKGILYSSSSLCTFNFEELENQISLYVHSPCQPKHRENTPHFNPAPVPSEWEKYIFRFCLMTSQLYVSIYTSFLSTYIEGVFF